jgi:hypothetical protein
MRTQVEEQDSANIREILANVKETNSLVQEIKLWRKFVFWSFGIVTVITTIWEVWKDFHGR